ncbi:hypothetical protein MTR67_034936 [Solanum verrucosum]|uniref:FCP1 homology domain-containing protein n=1 Tax=Solanum verrucosum TaxID=315347 RepID=A0AAF0ZJA8_SOLVR|nr:hypothetical protein MTR67_034936 [Solanum verrucosum]
MALTATATAHVREDILLSLHMSKATKLFSLRLSAIVKDVVIEKNKIKSDNVASLCFNSEFIERSKPIILKKLKKLLDKFEPDLPWERGEYDESHTLLLDDSPHKALSNPVSINSFFVAGKLPP